ncbi:MAG: hypothetical protein HRT57_08580 [Crocinitomicaceae bacterium]|nr:hypothetical protein [Crocinitomicaceae bacterium]
MQKLLIKYRFQGFPYIVADGKGIFYQLPHSTNSYYKSFRQLNRILNNGITEGYRINRKFVSVLQLRKIAYISNDIIKVENLDEKLPF